MRKKQVTDFLKKSLYKCLPKKYILFESVPDFGDNSKAVFDEMIQRGVNKQYKLVWMLGKDDMNYPRIPNVIYAKKNDKRRKIYMLLAKCMICCNAFLYTDNPEQKTFFLTHGMYVKRPTSYYTLPNEIQFCLSSSEHLKSIQAQALNVDMKKMFALGFPRNDVLTSPGRNIRSMFEVNADKIIVWYPTFRQHSSGMQTGSKHSIPIIWNEEYAKRVNSTAQSHNILIVIKPHFAQDISHIKEMNLSNVIFIDDSFFLKNNISSYEFLASCDALLSDYSSVYFDYTLCDKPIGLVWEDYLEYEKKPGFALDMNFYMKGGEKIYTVEELEDFIRSIANGIDDLKDERREIRDMCNYGVDGLNSMRVTNFILDQCEMKEFVE